VDGLPTVLQVLRAIRPNFNIGRAWMAKEFLKHNDAKNPRRIRGGPARHHRGHEPHLNFKKRVPSAIGLIRTGDTVQYANMILESA